MFSVSYYYNFVIFLNELFSVVRELLFLVGELFCVARELFFRVGELFWGVTWSYCINLISSF